MNIRNLAASALAAIAVFATPAVAQVTFPNQNPEAVIGKVAALCIERGHTILDITANKVSCESSISHDVKANIFISDFRHLGRYTDQVRLLFDFIVVPVRGDTIVQPRMWSEALIGGQRRIRERNSPEWKAQIEAPLKELALEGSAEQ